MEDRVLLSARDRRMVQPRSVDADFRTDRAIECCRGIVAFHPRRQGPALLFDLQEAEVLVKIDHTDDRTDIPVCGNGSDNNRFLQRQEVIRLIDGCFADFPSDQPPYEDAENPQPKKNRRSLRGIVSLHPPAKRASSHDE